MRIRQHKEFQPYFQKIHGLHSERNAEKVCIRKYIGRIQRQQPRPDNGGVRSAGFVGYEQVKQTPAGIFPAGILFAFTLYKFTILSYSIVLSDLFLDSGSRLLLLQAL